MRACVCVCDRWMIITWKNQTHAAVVSYEDTHVCPVN